MLGGSSFLATSAIRLITVIPACRLGLTLAKVTLNSLIRLWIEWFVKSCAIDIIMMEMIVHCMTLIALQPHIGFVACPLPSHAIRVMTSSVYTIYQTLSCSVNSVMGVTLMVIVWKSVYCHHTRIQPHSEKKKYFRGPFLVLQLVTNGGLYSVPGRTK